MKKEWKKGKSSRWKTVQEKTKTSCILFPFLPNIIRHSSFHQSVRPSLPPAPSDPSLVCVNPAYPWLLAASTSHILFPSLPSPPRWPFTSQSRGSNISLMRHYSSPTSPGCQAPPPSPPPPPPLPPAAFTEFWDGCPLNSVAPSAMSISFLFLRLFSRHSICMWSLRAHLPLCDEAPLSVFILFRIRLWLFWKLLTRFPISIICIPIHRRREEGRVLSHILPLTVPAPVLPPLPHARYGRTSNHLREQKMYTVVSFLNVARRITQISQRVYLGEWNG